MKIGIDASRANRKHKSGTEWYSYFLIKELAKIDSKNQYILYSNSPLESGLANLNSDFNSDNFKPTYDKNGFQIIDSPHNNFKAKILKWPFHFFWTQGRLSLEMLFKSPDVLFVPAHTLPLVCPKKSVTTIHDVGFRHEASLYAKDKIGIKNKILRLLIRMVTKGKYGSSSFDYLNWSTERALKIAKKIITISNFSKNEILRFYKNAKPDKIKVVYNGYDENSFKLIDDSEKTDKILLKYGIEKPYIFYVGRIEKKKNVFNLLEGYYILKKKYPELKINLCLAGDASFGYDELKYLIRELNIDDEVFLPGWVSKEDLPYIFSASSVFVFPSNYEGFGIPILEAFACGIPVVASNIESIAEVTAGNALLFNPKDPNDIALKLSEVLLNEQTRKNLIKKGLERVKSFSWEKCAKETLKHLID